jgi:hypothetical protein
MKTTKDLFVPYDLALELELVDFKTAYFGFYNNNHEIDFEIGIKGAPMWQQVFDFFFEKYGMSGCVVRKINDRSQRTYTGIISYNNGSTTTLNLFAKSEDARLELVHFMIFLSSKNLLIDDVC